MNLTFSTTQLRTELYQRLSDLFGDVILLDLLLFGQIDELSVYPLSTEEIRRTLNQRLQNLLADDVQEVGRIGQILLARYSRTP